MAGNDGYTKLLLHCNGDNGSVGFTDDCAGATPHVVTTFGAAQVSNAQVKFGNGSALFSGADGTGLLLDGSTDFAYGSPNDLGQAADFTIDMWIFPTSVTGTRIFFDQRQSGVNGFFPTLYLNAGVLTYFTNSLNQISGGAPPINTWSHVALARAGSSTRMFHGGGQVGITLTDSANYLNGIARPAIGADGFGTSGVNFAGYMDEIRISKGIARWTSNFTPDTAPYTRDPGRPSFPGGGLDLTTVRLPPRTVTF